MKRLTDSKRRRKKVWVTIFHSFEEAERANIEYSKNQSGEDSVRDVDIIRNTFLKAKYGYIPRLKRVYRIIRKK